MQFYLKSVQNFSHFINFKLLKKVTCAQNRFYRIFRSFRNQEAGRAAAIFHV